ncbi:MAG: hypothetical protein WKI04_12990 [Ferruginibacter sp.]
MKINLLVISLFLFFLSNAQIKKGTLYLGGDVQLYGSSYKSSAGMQYKRNTNNYNFSPSVGWVIKDNVIVGGRLLASFSSDKEEIPTSYENEGNRIGAGIWMRSYLPLGKSFFLFADAGINGQSIYLNQTNTQQPGSVYYERGFAINAAIYPGLSYQVKKSLFIEAALINLISLAYERKNTEQGNSNSSFLTGVSKSYSLSSSLGNGVPLQIGVRWIIARK